MGSIWKQKDSIVNGAWTMTGSKVLSINEAERTLDAIMTTTAKDRQGDRVSARGLDFTNFMRNPVVLWNHDQKQEPIGKVLSINKEDGQIIGRVQFADTERGNGVFKLYKGGYLNAWSIGFITKDAQPNGKGDDIMESEMVELSAVPIPANPEAITRACSEGVVCKSLAEELLTKGTAPDINDEPDPSKEALVPEEAGADVEDDMEEQECPECGEMVTPTDESKCPKCGADMLVEKHNLLLDSKGDLTIITKYSPDQERDESGRFGSGGGAGDDKEPTKEQRVGDRGIGKLGEPSEWMKGVTKTRVASIIREAQFGKGKPGVRPVSGVGPRVGSIRFVAGTASLSKYDKDVDYELNRIARNRELSDDKKEIIYSGRDNKKPWSISMPSSSEYDKEKGYVLSPGALIKSIREKGMPVPEGMELEIEPVEMAEDGLTIKQAKVIGYKMKEGRSISTANRERLAMLLERMGSVFDEMQALLDENAPPQKPAVPLAPPQRDVANVVAKAGADMALLRSRLAVLDAEDLG